MGQLEAIAARIEGRVEGHTVHGTCGGVAVTFRMTSRGTESWEERWTEIEAELPPAYSLVIHLRWQEGQHEYDVRRGLMVDVEVGDPGFDEAFTIEAAPADVVRILLDRAARTLLGRMKCTLDTVDRGERRVLRLALPSWYEEPDTAADAIREVARIASRVREAFARVEQAPVPGDRGGPYRTELDDGPRRAAAVARDEEVARLHAVRAARARRDRILVIVTVAALVLIVVALLLVLPTGDG